MEAAGERLAVGTGRCCWAWAREAGGPTAAPPARCDVAVSNGAWAVSAGACGLTTAPAVAAAVAAALRLRSAWTEAFWWL